MHVNQLFHKLFNKTMHKKRLAALSEVCETVLQTKSLSVSQVGRRIINTAQTRSNIRKVDRLYSNSNLLAERLDIYRLLNRWIIRTSSPQLNIDGSKLLNSRFYTLRATLQLSGRGITVYEKIFTQDAMGSQELYLQFIAGLA